MTQDEFIHLMQDIKKTPPINEAKTQFIEKRFRELGYTNLIGYKSIQYYYNELENAYNGKETIFKGKAVKLEDSWGMVDSSGYFAMYYNDWVNIKDVIFMTTKDKTFIEYFSHKRKERLAQKLKAEFSGSKGKTIALMIYTIRDYLINEPIVKKELYKAMAEYFGKSVGSDASINKVLNNGLLIVDIKFIKTDHEKMIRRVDKIGLKDL